MIKFKLPAKDEPGYLKRQRNLAVSQDTSVNSVDRWDAMVEYLLQFVIEPEDRDEAREALWQQSEEQHEAMLAEIKALGEVSKNT